jgi:hypothetical protein
MLALISVIEPALAVVRQCSNGSAEGIIDGSGTTLGTGSIGHHRVIAMKVGTGGSKVRLNGNPVEAPRCLIGPGQQRTGIRISIRGLQGRAAAP